MIYRLRRNPVIFPFRLYSLENCPFCLQARNFLVGSGVPWEDIISDNDPIIKTGIEKLAGEDRFPVLLSRVTNEIILGWKEEDYKRVVEAYNRINGAGATNLSVDRKPVVGEGEKPPTANPEANA